METFDAQISQTWKKLKKGITKAGLSATKFAEYAYGELHEFEDEKKAESFPKTFAKQLIRGCEGRGKHELAETYLKILYHHPEYAKRMGHVPPRNVDFPEIDEPKRIGLRRVSRLLDDHLRFDDEATDYEED